MTEWLNDWMTGWMNEWMNEWRYEGTNERTKEGRKERTNERMNQLMNAYTTCISIHIYIYIYNITIFYFYSMSSHASGAPPKSYLPARPWQRYAAARAIPRPPGAYGIGGWASCCGDMWGTFTTKKWDIDGIYGDRDMGYLVVRI